MEIKKYSIEYESELIAIYNQVPQVLARKVIKVSIVDNQANKHIFNKPRYNTALALFQCEGYDPSRKQKFHVTQPAKVIRLPEDQWRLEEKGILEFYSQG